MHEIRSIVASPEGRQLIAPKAKKKPAGTGSLAAIPVKREEVRRSDQRREDRHPRLQDQAILTFRRKKHEVQLVNISSHGAMIACDLVPRIGENVSIELEGTNRIAGAVRWVRDGRIGVEFREETVVLAPRAVQSHIFDIIEGGRGRGQLEVRNNRPQRHGFIWRGDLHTAGGTLPARLRNISAEGAMVESDRDLEEGQQVVLDLGPAGTAIGIVRWSRSRQLGIKFDHPFDMRDLAAVRPGGESSPQMVKPKYLESDGSADSPLGCGLGQVHPRRFDAGQVGAGRGVILAPTRSPLGRGSYRASTRTISASSSARIVTFSSPVTAIPSRGSARTPLTSTGPFSATR
jgi:hypothetical protein